MAKRKNDTVPVAGDGAYEKRREEIRASATHVFASRGYASATMRDIADEIGLLAGSLYHYFPSKEDLLVEGMQAFYDDTVRDLTAVIKRGEDPVDTLKAMVALAVRFLIERPDEASIIRNDFDYLKVIPAFEFVETAADAVERLWVGVLKKGIKSGAFRSDFNPELVYRTIMGSVFSAARWYRPDGPMKTDAFVAQLSTTFLDGFLVRARATPRDGSSSRPSGVSPK
jgi:TetR/AcrR family transcriptional regulator, cholesterol catabolism regulator